MKELDTEDIGILDRKQFRWVDGSAKRDADARTRSASLRAPQSRGSGRTHDVHPFDEPRSNLVVGCGKKRTSTANDCASSPHDTRKPRRKVIASTLRGIRP